MARKAKIAKAIRLRKEYEKAIKAGKKPKFPTRLYNICSVTGRTRGYLGKYGVSRIVFRELANKWELPGVRKSSW